LEVSLTQSALVFEKWEPGIRPTAADAIDNLRRFPGSGKLKRRWWLRINPREVRSA